MMTQRQYDIIVFGATGYTGKLTAEHIATNLPTDLKWALAGRSAQKLEAVAETCKRLNPNRIQPGIEIVSLNDEDLSSLARKTTVLIATVGPYALHGEIAVKACATTGTHYLDVTGEVPWVADMIKKYERTAQASGSIMIPQIGVESAPADLVTWSLVNNIRTTLGVGTRECVVSVHELNGAPSGGTLSTIFTLLDVFSLKQVSASSAPYALSPIPGPKSTSHTSLLTTIFGIRTVPDLGLLTTSIAAMADRPIVHRSWGLLGGASFYGPNFTFSEYMKARNYLVGMLTHMGLMLGGLLLAIPVFRKVAKRYVYQPGDGPTREQASRDRVEYRAIATPDTAEGNGQKRAFCRAWYEGSLYGLTGIFLAEAANSILKDGHNLSGGIYTPASLGQKFIDRLGTAGFKFENKFLEN